jgi:hypothetical protein
MYKAINVHTAFWRGRRRARNSLSSTRSLAHRQFRAAMLYAVRRVAAARARPRHVAAKAGRDQGKN